MNPLHTPYCPAEDVEISFGSCCGEDLESAAAPTLPTAASPPPQLVPAPVVCAQLLPIRPTMTAPKKQPFLVPPPVTPSSGAVPVSTPQLTGGTGSPLDARAQHDDDDPVLCTQLRAALYDTTTVDSSGEKKGTDVPFDTNIPAPAVPPTVQTLLSMKFDTAGGSDTATPSLRFRTGQWEAIWSITAAQRIMHDRSGGGTLAVLPTGWGKSLIYEFIACWLKHARVVRRLVLVITPLVSLMRDQVERIERQGVVTAECLTSDTSMANRERVENMLRRPLTSQQQRWYTPPPPTTPAEAIPSDVAPRGEWVLRSGVEDDMALDILFVAPERLVTSASFQRALRPALASRIACVCIDEAHCVSEWSHDFRPSFMYTRHVLLQLAGTATGNAVPPILALTATASPSVQRSLMAELKLGMRACIQEVRPNLTFFSTPVLAGAAVAGGAPGVVPTALEGPSANSSPWWGQLEERLIGLVHSSGLPMLVYVNTHQECEVLSNALRRRLGEGDSSLAGDASNRGTDVPRGHGKRPREEPEEPAEGEGGAMIVLQEEVQHPSLQLPILRRTASALTRTTTTTTASGLPIKVRAYHAGMSTADRRHVQRAFMNNGVTVLVATVAFGLGIHKPDIRTVLHVGVPAALETFIQETGRAGRDGLPAVCGTLYDARMYYEMRSRLVYSKYLSLAECKAAIEAVVNCLIDVGDIEGGPAGRWWVGIFSSDMAAIDVGISSEAVETLLFSLAVLNPDDVHVLPRLPKRARVRSLGAAAAATASGQAKFLPSTSLGTKGLDTTQLYRQLGLDDPVVMYLTDAARHGSGAGGIGGAAASGVSQFRQLRDDQSSSVVDTLRASMALKLPLEEFIDRVETTLIRGNRGKGSNAAGKPPLSISWMERGFQVRVRQRFLQKDSTAGGPAAASFIEHWAGVLFQHHERHMSRCDTKLRQCFDLLRVPNREEMQQHLSKEADDATMTALSSAVPPPLVSKPKAAEIVQNFFAEYRSRVESAEEAALVLAGVRRSTNANVAPGANPAGGATGSLVFAKWYSNTYFAKLHEIELPWLIRLCTLTFGAPP